MQCIRCGKEMENTTGGNYHCPSCGHSINDLVYRPSNCDIPMPQGFGEQKGWICPVCGRGVAPWVNYCPCQANWKITYGTSTSDLPQIDINEYIEEYNRRIDSDKGLKL